MKKFALAFAALALSACGPTQSEECAKYVECAAHYDAEMDTSTDTSAYDTDGTCWQSTAEAADACSEACKNAVDGLKSALEASDKDVGACG